MDNLTALSDATVGEDVLGLVLVAYDGRWPEPRALWQDEAFWLPDRTRLDLAALSGDGVRALVALLVGAAAGLHAVAVRDEDLTASSGLRRAMAHAGVPTIAEVDPLVWLESTLLVRSLRARLR